ncbi:MULTISPECIES: hypothetical protein [unclassified Phenylobacterium]|uniref:hypothetical protein n=1 Tax=unclassified Phenylobacterium TaxID=2640670 RepID=UPI0009E87A87|nr:MULTISPECIES: hypothetical protein [unclassified Phenylobacterium]
MRNLIRNRDLKTLLSGVSIAAAAGLVMGAALYPDLDEDEIRGPQILLSGGGPRGEAPVSDAGIGVYAGRVPDYVIGTDALKPPQHQVLAYEDRAEPELADTGETGDVMAYEAPPEIQPARWHDEPREPSRYPSEHGNAVHEADLAILDEYGAGGRTRTDTP